MARTGRPSRFNLEVAARIAAAAREHRGLDRSAEIAAAGVGASTYFRWMARGREGVEPFASLVRLRTAAATDAFALAVWRWSAEAEIPIYPFLEADARRAGIDPEAVREALRPRRRPRFPED